MVDVVVADAALKLVVATALADICCFFFEALLLGDENTLLLLLFLAGTGADVAFDAAELP